MKNKKLKTRAESKRDYHNKFKGSTIYYIKHKKTKEIKYVGETGYSVAERYNQHFTAPSGNSSFNRWCIENNINKADYEMFVLDLSEYKELDDSDRKLLEHMLIRYHNLTVVNRCKRKALTPLEQERVEYLLSFIDFKFKSFLEIRESKRIRKSHKKNS